MTFFLQDITHQYIHVSVVQGKQCEQKKEELLKKVKSHDNHHHICFLTEIEHKFIEFKAQRTDGMIVNTLVQRVYVLQRNYVYN